jgi:hypothetical protein
MPQNSLVPAKAGTQHKERNWIPAFAGMSGGDEKLHPLVPAMAF